MSTYEDELRRVVYQPRWSAPHLEPLIRALESLDATMGELAKSDGWEGAAADAAAAKWQHLRTVFAEVAAATGQVQNRLEAANQALDTAKLALDQLPDDQVPDYIEGAAKVADVGAMIFIPMLGRYKPAESAVAAVEEHLAEVRAAQAHTAYQVLENALGAHAQFLNSHLDEFGAETDDTDAGSTGGSGGTVRSGGTGGYIGAGGTGGTGAIGEPWTPDPGYSPMPQDPVRPPSPFPGRGTGPAPDLIGIDDPPVYYYPPRPPVPRSGPSIDDLSIGHLPVPGGSSAGTGWDTAGSAVGGGGGAGHGSGALGSGLLGGAALAGGAALRSGLGGALARGVAGGGAGGLAGAGASNGLAAGASATGAGAAAPGGAGMMGHAGGMGGRQDSKDKKRGLGGPMAPKLADDEVEFTPLPEGARAGGREALEPPAS